MQFDVIIGNPTFSNADLLKNEYTKISVGQQDESVAENKEIYVKKQK
ncbi:MAG: Eco57I restriction-modification methylase domain-containing protein [Tyzzerella sp.]|nr:Eco57I restriction-modification methylase domain-containing protein [Tyzzerella sp.]